MERRTSRCLWIIAFFAGFGFILVGKVLHRPQKVLVQIELDAEQGVIEVQVSGSYEAVLRQSAYTLKGVGVAIDWKAARVTVGGLPPAVPKSSALGNGVMSLSVVPMPSLEAECQLRYTLRLSTPMNGSDDIVQADGMAGAWYGVVAMSKFLPRQNSGPRTVQYLVDLATSGEEDVEWIPEGSHRTLFWSQGCTTDLTKGNVAVLSSIDDPAESENMFALVERVEDKCGSVELGKVVFETDRGPGCISVGGQVLVVLGQTGGERARMAIGRALWMRNWGAFGPLEGRSAVDLIRHYGAPYFGAAATATSKQLARLQRQCLVFGYSVLAAGKVRPILTRAGGKENWALLVPAYLASLQLCLASSGHSDADFYQAARFLGRMQAVEFQSWVEGAPLSGCEEVVSMMREGIIPGVDVPISSGASMEWFSMGGAKPTQTLPTTEMGLGILVGANIEEYLETCGCKLTQTGGLPRRATLVTRARETEYITLDCGGFLSGTFNRTPDEAEAAYQSAFLNAFASIANDAVTISYKDVCSGILNLVRGNTLAEEMGLVCANIHPPRGTAGFPAYRVVERGGKRVALVGWLGTRVPMSRLLAFEEGLRGWTVDEGFATLPDALKVAGMNADCVILFGNLSHDQLRDYRPQLQGVDIVLTSNALDPGDWAFSRKSGKYRAQSAPYLIDRTLILSIGYGTGVMERFTGINPGSGVEVVEGVLLDDTVGSDPEIEKIISSIASAFSSAAAKITSVLPDGDGYVGARKCATCHKDEYASWKETPHALAMTTLTMNRRDRHPECVKCHVTGFGVKQGFVTSNLRSSLRGVQCEVCHGPGQRHSVEGAVDSIERIPAQRICGKCHNAEHSDQFFGRFAEALLSVSHQ